MSPGGEHPVDRGWAWVVLLASLGSHFLNGALGCSVGILHTVLLGHFSPESVTMVAMTGAVNSSLMCIAAPIAGYVINRFGCRTCCVLGGLSCFAGYAASSFVTSVILLFFSFGLTAGTGLGLTYSATNVTMGFYFERHRGLASGISNSFNAVGILTGSVCLQTKIETFSVSRTFLLLGAVSRHFCFFGMFYRPTMYEGKVVDIVVEEQATEDCRGMQARYSEAPRQDRRTSGHTMAQQHKVCDTEEGSESLLESNQQSHNEGHGDVISGLSHAPDDVNTSDMETNRTAAETMAPKLLEMPDARPRCRSK